MYLTLPSPLSSPFPSLPSSLPVSTNPYTHILTHISLKLPIPFLSLHLFLLCLSITPSPPQYPIPCSPHSHFTSSICLTPTLFFSPFPHFTPQHPFPCSPLLAFPQLEVNFREITEKYEQEFFSDMDRLRVWRPSLAPRVTEHVPHIIAFTQGIMDRGLAYVAADGGCVGERGIGGVRGG